MSKKTIFKIFKFFSILLIANFILFPLISFIFGIGDECEYGILKCIGVSLLFLLIVAIFWCLSWWNIYVLFIKDYKIINFKDIGFSPLKFNNWLTQKWFLGSNPINKFRRYVIASIVALECLGVLYLCYIQVLEIFKLLIQKL